MSVIIMAPHVDDEVIGCFSLLDRVSCVIYTKAMSRQREIEAIRLAQFKGWDCKFSTHTLAEQKLMEILTDHVPNPLVLAPDPHWELHPSHKELGGVINTCCQGAGIRFGTYSTNMNVPYLQELGIAERKEKMNMLNDRFPSQSDMWKYDHKYFLFEGICEWNPRG